MIGKSRPSSAMSVATASTAETSGGSPFSPISFLSLLSDGAPVKEMKVYSEKDLQKAFATVITGLNKVDDWQARTSALLSLQGLTIGDGPSFEASFLAHLKGCHELIMTQIADLRSSVSKEACRTVALLAVKMGNSFAILGEFWLNALMKQVVVKIAVMSSAADRCIRVVVCSSTSGYIKILNQIIDYCSSKSPMTRRSAYEYISLACATWKMETLEKSLAPLKGIVKVGIADADPNVRKAARQYFWVLRNRIQLQPLMDSFLNDLDPASQRHIVSELQNPSADLNILLDLVRKQMPPLENYLSDPSLFSLESAKGATDACGNETSKTPSRAGSAPRGANRSLSSTTQQSLKATAEQTTAQDLESGNGVVSKAPSSAGLSGPSRRMSMGVSGPSRIIQKTALSDIDSAVTTSSSVSMRIIKEKDSVVAVDETFSKTNGNYENINKRVNTISENAMVSIQQSAVTQTTSFGQPMRAPDLPAEVAAAAALNNQALAKKSIFQGAQRVIAKQQSAKKPEDESKGNNGMRQQKSASTTSGDSSEMSIELMKAAVDDVHWENRLAACEAIRNRLQRASIMEEAISSSFIDNFVELAVAFLNDAHQKVVSEAMDIITFCVEHHGVCMIEKLGLLLPAIFHRLADRRSQIRDQANAILNTLRVVVEPNVLVGALSPKILDIPEKMKTAVIQYLVVLVPHCSSYFSQPQNTWAFLGRMGNVLGCTGSKPSTTLVVAARRLLDLVYSAVPSIVCAQIATLSLQQQSVLKKMLEPSVPDIDNLVMMAGRSDWKKTVSNSKVLETEGVSSVFNNTTHMKVANEAVSSTADGYKSKDSNSHLERDITWLLDALRWDASRNDKIEANTELRKLIKSENGDYWRNNCAQIVCVLLEPFNAAANMTDKSSAAFQSPPSFHEKKKLTGLSPVINELENNCANIASSSHLGSEVSVACMTRFETMHLSCKALLLLVKYKATHVITFMDLLVSRLCQAAAYAPVAITLHCEQILADLAPHSPHRLLRLATPYSAASTGPHVQLLAIHTICVAIKHMSSPQILEDIKTTVSAILPSLSNSIVDLRKAVIFVLVEIYMNIGDALYPYIVDLQPPQRKLLTIYIQKQLEGTK